MEELEIRALLEGAYALTPTLPGNYLRYDEFRTCFNKLVEKRNNVPLDVEKLLESYIIAKFICTDCKIQMCIFS